MEEILISLLFILCLSPCSQSFASVNNTVDYKSLVDIKDQFLKQSNSASSATFMSSWNEANPFCSWEGVTCGHEHSDRVTALDLSSIGLAGPLPPAIANLTFLKRLDFSNNGIYGEIPPYLARLQRLEHLNLSFNSFHGDIPAILVTNSSVF
ncbi:hypothetical protein KFK09_027673 [Dendrobium nobile]|uniref:Leucine-rich repeat-containing N-terminal plant-type domain-containing protein n=1 Tax=Dendrobium nobile TaxID=94219 RepID=A0A8T3A1C7_DENNO|nr:hypothetical protein KFK09_027673 [Dendrobium nobile]